MKKQMHFLAGVLCGAMMFGGVTAAAVELVVKPSWQPIYVDGEQVSMEAYNINGNNYVKLRDIGREVGFNVFWDNGVQVDSTAEYTGEPPAAQVQEVMPSEALSKVDPDTNRQEIIRLTNVFRQEQGLPLVVADEKLMEAAQVRAQEMAATCTYSHTRPNGEKYYMVMDCHQLYENIHLIDIYWVEQGMSVAEKATDGWIKSAGHRETLENPTLTKIGVGVVPGLDICGKEGWYCVQLFCSADQTITWVDTPAIP